MSSAFVCPGPEQRGVSVSDESGPETVGGSGAVHTTTSLTNINNHIIHALLNVLVLTINPVDLL